MPLPSDDKPHEDKIRTISESNQNVNQNPINLMTTLQNNFSKNYLKNLSDLGQINGINPLSLFAGWGNFLDVDMVTPCSVVQNFIPIPFFY